MSWKVNDRKLTESKRIARSRRDPELERVLRKAVANGPAFDYEQFRADIDAVADPTLRDWWAWKESADRHIRRDLLDLE